MIHTLARARELIAIAIEVVALSRNLRGVAVWRRALWKRRGEMNSWKESR